MGCRVLEARGFVARREGAREDRVEATVDVGFAVAAVVMLVSLPSSSDSGDGRGIVLRLRLGEDWTGLDTGTAEAERRTPAVVARVTLGILTIASFPVK